MREILFRGKTDKGEWVEGDLLNVGVDYDYAIRTYGGREHGQVNATNEKTVGQYTGLTDKNGKKIFEGDIILGLFLHSCPVNSLVAFQDGAFGLLWNRAGAETFWAFTSICNVEYEIIGNIHDNPELLKDGE
jgi:uncharacterized phage protein (TIGR01671 family)